MFIRNVTLKLKANSISDFNLLVEKEILPMLRKQNGFRDELICVAPERLEALAISFWDTKESLEAYNKTTYPTVLKTLSKVVEGNPRVENFELSISTLHKLTAKAQV